jgi:hypothetical protein
MRLRLPLLLARKRRGFCCAMAVEASIWVNYYNAGGYGAGAGNEYGVQCVKSVRAMALIAAKWQVRRKQLNYQITLT